MDPLDCQAMDTPPNERQPEQELSLSAKESTSSMLTKSTLAGRVCNCLSILTSLVPVIITTAAEGTEPLTIDDLRDVLERLWNARTKWYHLGIELGVPLSELDAIAMDNRYDMSSCLTSVVKFYLSNTSHTKSWSEIINALKSPYIDYGYLAKVLESEILGNVAAEKSGAASTTLDYKLDSVEPSCLDLDAMPTLSQLQMLKSPEGRIRIIQRLSPFWLTIGDLLDFDANGSRLMDIENDYPNDPESCCRAVLRHWLMGNGVRPCSWQKLIEILEDADQQILADEIKAYSMQPNRK